MFAAMLTNVRRLGAIGPARAVASLAVAAVAATACSEDPPAAPRPVREIRVRLACDDAWRAQPGWEALARGRLGAASDVFEERFAIRWKVVDVVPWTSDAQAMTMSSLLGDMRRKVSRQDVDITIGFTGRTSGRRSDDDYEATGTAAYLGPAALVRRTFPDVPEAQSLKTLLHEMGHLLGAWHSADPRSVMFGTPSDAARDGFDAQSAAMIEIARDCDFSRGADWLDGPRRARVDAVFRLGHAADAELPYAWDERVRGMRLLSDPQTSADGLALCRRALADEEACVGPKDPSILPALRTIARADIHRASPADTEEAERLAVRMHDIVVAGELVETPPLESAVLLACVAVERGRADEGATILGEVQAARRAALGADHPDTAEAAGLLTWCDGKPAPVVRPVTWAESRWRAPASSGPSVFDKPAAGTFHVRSVVLEPPWTVGPGVDAARETFALAVPCAGRVALEFREADGAARSQPPHRVTAHLDGRQYPFVAPTVGFGCRQVGGGTEGSEDYVVELQVRPSENAGLWRLESFRCAVPRSAGARVTRVVESPGSRFLELPDGTTLLRCWQWVGGSPKAAIAFENDAAGAADGVRFTPDGAGAQRTWRLELTFTPDPPK